MMRKMLLAAALSVTAMTAHADYQCSVTPRDDVIVSPQTVQVKGENGNLVITPDGNVMYNGKQYSLNAAQREQAKYYQAELRSTLPWIDEGAKSRVEKARIALDKIIVQEMGESSTPDPGAPGRRHHGSDPGDGGRDLYSGGKLNGCPELFSFN